MKIRVSIVLAAVCLVAASGCAANADTISKLPDDLYGSYIFEKQIYMNPLSSFYAGDGLKEYYELSEDTLIITSAGGIKQTLPVVYEKTEVDNNDFHESSFIGSLSVPDISGFKERYLVMTGSDDTIFDIFRLYMMDGGLWLARMHPGKEENETYIWSIYQIKSYDGEIPKGPDQNDMDIMINTAYPMAQDWYENAYPAGTSINKNTADINTDTGTAGVVEVRFQIPDISIWVGISFEESDDGDWSPVPVNTLTVYDLRQAAQSGTD